MDKLYTLNIKAILPNAYSASIPYDRFDLALKNANVHMVLGAKCEIIANLTGELIFPREPALVA